MKKTTSQYSVIDDRKTNTNLTKYVEKHLEIVVSSQDIFKNTFYSRVLTKHVDLGWGKIDKVKPWWVNIMSINHDAIPSFSCIL